MLIQFFPNGKGGGAGPVNYLTDREVLAYDENRNLIRDGTGQPQTITRDPLPEVLRGDPQRMIDLIDACRTSGAIARASSASRVTMRRPRTSSRP